MNFPVISAILFLNDHDPDLEDGVGVAGDGDDPLGAGAIADVDLGPALLPDLVNGLPALANDGAHLLARGEAAESEIHTGHIPR